MCIQDWKKKIFLDWNQDCFLDFGSPIDYTSATKESRMKIIKEMFVDFMEMVWPLIVLLAVMGPDVAP